MNDDWYRPMRLLTQFHDGQREIKYAFDRRRSVDDRARDGTVARLIQKAALAVAAAEVQYAVACHRRDTHCHSVHLTCGAFMHQNDKKYPGLVTYTINRYFHYYFSLPEIAAIAVVEAEERLARLYRALDGKK